MGHPLRIGKFKLKGGNMKAIKTIKKENVNKSPNNFKEPNIFVNNFKKCIGREVSVTMYTTEGLMKLKGICEGLDYSKGSIILKNGDSTYIIPKYLYIERPRRYK